MQSSQYRQSKPCWGHTRFPFDVAVGDGVMVLAKRYFQTGSLHPPNGPMPGLPSLGPLLLSNRREALSPTASQDAGVGPVARCCHRPIFSCGSKFREFEVRTDGRQQPLASRSLEWLYCRGMETSWHIVLSGRAWAAISLHIVVVLLLMRGAPSSAQARCRPGRPQACLCR